MDGVGIDAVSGSVVRGVDGPTSTTGVVGGVLTRNGTVRVDATGLVPHEIVLLEPGTLPRTSSGKLRRGETLRQWKDGTLQPPDRVTPLFLAGTMARSALGYFKARRESE